MQRKFWAFLFILIMLSAALAACGRNNTAPAATAATATAKTPESTPAPPTASPTPGPTATPTLSPTPTPTPTQILQTGEIWYDKDHKIPALIGSVAMMDKNHPMQVDAAKEMVRYWLESPYTQRLLDKLMKDHPDTNGVYCAYTQAFDNPGKQTKLNAKTDVPGGIIYPTSRNLAVATYINSQFLLNVKPNPSESEINPETGWLLDKEQVPEYKDADIIAVSPTFYLGYFEGYGKLFVNWQQLCGGLPYLTWDPYKGFLTRDMLKNPDIVDELQPGTAVALAEALFYELERSETGYGKVRETFYEPYLPSTLLDLNVKVNFDKANKILEENGYPILPFSRPLA